MSRWIKLTSLAGLVACSYLTVLMVFAGIAAACSGGGGGGGGCAAPSVSTGGYDALTSNSVTLTGSVNPQGCYTEYAFEYGRSSEGYPDEIYGSAGSGTSPVSVSTSSAIVQPSTSYHYRLTAWNSVDEVTGTSGSFTTPPACTKPTVKTEAASFVTADKAFLNGQVNPNGCSTSYTFEYGLAGSGTYAKLSGTVGVLGPFSVSKEASGLQAGKLYTFRLTAENATGKAPDGSWLNFSTTPSANDPVLFIHGWNPAAGGWNQMISWFQQDGWPPSYLNDWTYTWSQSNVTTAGAITSKVNHILSTTGKTKVDLITHSMGSLSARYYLKNLGGTLKVDDFVSLAGPNHGTSDAALSGPFGCSNTPVSCNEMKYNSTFLTNLNSVDETPGAVNYGTWRSSDQCDGVVFPSSSVVLNGADNRGPWCVFHTEVRKDYPIYFEVREFVR